MDIKCKINRCKDHKDFFDMEIKTYKESITGKFHKSELRYLIQNIDNEI